MVNDKCPGCNNLRHELTRAEKIMAKTIDIICDPVGGLYERIATQDARIRRLIIFAKRQREKLNGE